MARKSYRFFLVALHTTKSSGGLFLGERPPQCRGQEMMPGTGQMINLPSGFLHFSAPGIMIKDRTGKGRKNEEQNDCIERGKDEF